MLCIPSFSVLSDSLDDVEVDSATCPQVSEVHSEPEDRQSSWTHDGRQTNSPGVLSSFPSSTALPSRMTIAYSRGAKFKIMGQVPGPNSGLAVLSYGFYGLLAQKKRLHENSHRLSGVHCMKDARYARFGDLAPFWRLLHRFGDRKMTFGGWQ